MAKITVQRILIIVSIVSVPDFLLFLVQLLTLIHRVSCRPGHALFSEWVVCVAREDLLAFEVKNGCGRHVVVSESARSFVLSRRAKSNVIVL